MYFNHISKWWSHAHAFLNESMPEQPHHQNRFNTILCRLTNIEYTTSTHTITKCMYKISFFFFFYYVWVQITKRRHKNYSIQSQINQTQWTNRPDLYNIQMYIIFSFFFLFSWNLIRSNDIWKTKRNKK